MSPVTEKIEQAFKKLAPREQARTLNRLESVVYGEEGFDPAYVKEIRRRVAEVKSGKARKINAFKALKRM